MAEKKSKIILALETSCDETAAAVLEYTPNKKWPKIKTLSSIVKSQISIHKSFGGVVPEVAARAHVKYIRPVVERALHASCFMLHDIDYIAVTAGPGLIPSLMVGVEFAKALSFATGKPLIPVNHMMGHLYSPFGREFPISNFQFPKIFPMISLIVSGGHTILVLMKDIKHYKVLGQTVDDAAGEAFDKVAKMLNLPYPGGPEVSKLAADGNPKSINFPRPMLNKNNYNFSFSGLKTSVLYYIRDNPLTPKTQNLIPNICASFQQAVVDVLVGKTMRAAREFNAKSISLSGGVAANQELRRQLIVNCKKPTLSGVEGLKVKFFAPPMNLCTDNAEMIGLAAAFSLHNGKKPVSYKQALADSNLTL